MRKAITTLTALTAISAALFAAPAGAEQIVPPGNSAANQYTEAFPTARGEEMQNGDELKAKDVLGARDTKKLEQHGKTGREVAQFAAETAPAPVAATDSPGDTGTADRDGKQGKNARNGKQDANGDEAATTGGSGGSGSGPSAGGGASSVNQPSGSSGVGEVVSEATGISAGRLGLWLPLIVIGAAIWAAAYFIRQRQHRVA